MIKTITSPQNPLIKQLVQLKEKSRERKKSGQFLIEGKRELSLAIKGKYTIETVFFFADLFSESEAKALSQYNIEIIEISKEVFQKLAHRATTEGVIALVKSKNHTLEALKLQAKNPLILVAEAPEKPGNIGALLRTADAANVDAQAQAEADTQVQNEVQVQAQAKVKANAQAAAQADASVAANAKVKVDKNIQSKPTGNKSGKKANTVKDFADAFTAAQPKPQTVSQPSTGGFFNF